MIVIVWLYDAIGRSKLDGIDSDYEYNHIVTIMGVGTNQQVNDSAYYADDVLILDDVS